MCPLLGVAVRGGIRSGGPVEVAVLMDGDLWRYLSGDICLAISVWGCSL
jgi:hypothetical protein